MSSGSAAFKAAAVAAVLALLVLPSLGRCPSLGPAPSPPAPATPPAPAPIPAPAPPPVGCDCRASLIPPCQSKCEASVAAACSGECDPTVCDECHAKVSNCTACCNDGSCSCDCKKYIEPDCRSSCYNLYNPNHCPACIQRSMGECMGDCLRRGHCDAACRPLW